MLICVSFMKRNPIYQILKRLTPKILFLLVKFGTLKEKPNRHPTENFKLVAFSFSCEVISFFYPCWTTSFQHFLLCESDEYWWTLKLINMTFFNNQSHTHIGNWWKKPVVKQRNCLQTKGDENCFSQLILI